MRPQHRGTCGLDSRSHTSTRTVDFLHDTGMLLLCGSFTHAVRANTPDEMTHFASCELPVRLLAILVVEGVLHSVSLTLAYPARRIGGLNWTGLWPMLTSGGLMRSRFGNLTVLLVPSLICCVHSTLSARLASSL